MNLEGAYRTSDPFAVVTHVATTPGEQPKCLGRTEEATNNLSPKWLHVFRLEWVLGTPLKICVQIFDKVGKHKYKSMGSAYFDVGQILGSPGCHRTKNLRKGGVLAAYIRKGTGAGELRLKLKGLQLRNVEGFLKKSDPFYEIHRRTENDEGFIEWEQVYRSKTIMDNLNPTWPEVVICVLNLGGNLNHPIKLVIYDHRKDGNHEYMGEVQLSVNRLIDASTEGLDEPKRAIPLSFTKSKGHKAKQVVAGKIMVLEAHVRGVSDNFDFMAGVSVKSGAPLHLLKSKGKPNFVDYVTGGCEFNICFAVDFTGSNGDPMKPGSRHFLDPNGGFNDYEKSMIALLNVLGRFDRDNHFALWGFGAKYHDEVYNVFQCGKKRLIPGIDGILQAYRDQFRSGITMARTPTVFTEIINTAAAHARRVARVAENIDQQAYTILCILTDGDVEDVEGTIAALEEASSAPLSVVFVGIGDTDFSQMRFIDDDRQEQTQRDIAQFVQFNEHSTHSQQFTFAACQEIPQQLVDYFEANEKAPLPEIDVDDEDLIVLPDDPEIGVVIKFDEEQNPSLKRGGIEYHDIFRELLG